MTATLESPVTETVVTEPRLPFWRVLQNVTTDQLESTLNGLKAERYFIHDMRPHGQDWIIVARTENYAGSPLNQLHGIRRQLERIGNLIIATHNSTQPKKNKKVEPTEEPKELKASA